MYEAYYHFSAKPFQLSPTSAFSTPARVTAAPWRIWSTAFTRRRVHRHHRRDRRRQDTLARALARRMESQNLVLAQVVSTQLERRHVRMVAAAFGLPHHDSKAVLLRNWRSSCSPLTNKAGARCCWWTRRRTFPRGSGGTAHAVEFPVRGKIPAAEFSVGQPEFRKTLQRPELSRSGSGSSPRATWGRWTRRNEAYIVHRLQTVGWSGDPSIGEDAFAAIYRTRAASAKDQRPVQPPAAPGLHGRETRDCGRRSGRSDRRTGAGVCAGNAVVRRDRKQDGGNRQKKEETGARCRGNRRQRDPNEYAGRVCRYSVRVGARPNFMKIAPVIRAMQEQSTDPGAVGPHGPALRSEMNSQYFERWDSGSRHQPGVGRLRTPSRLRRSCGASSRSRPRASCGVLVVGDVNSTVACALVAVKKASG